MQFPRVQARQLISIVIYSGFFQKKTANIDLQIVDSPVKRNSSLRKNNGYLYQF